MDQAPLVTPEETTQSDNLPTASLGLKLTLVSVGLLFVAFIIYTIISIRISQGAITKNVEESLRADTADTIGHIQVKLTEVRTVADNLAIAIETGIYNKTSLGTAIESTVTRNQEIFGAAAGYEPDQFEFGLFYWSPYYYRATDDSIQFTQLGDYDYFNQEWYFLPKRTLAPTLSAPYRNNSRGNGETWIITWSTPFYNRQGEFRGVASADLDFSKIQDTFIDLKFGQNGYAFLIDANGTILGIGQEGNEYVPMIDSMFAIANRNAASNWLDLIRNMVNGDTGFMEARDVSGNSMYVSYAPVGLDTGWSLALVYPREEVLQQSRQLQTALTGYGLLLAFLFGIIFFYFTRTITNPLRQLTQVAERISSGDLQATASVDSLDEVGVLGETFNRMTAQLRDMLANLERRIAERTVDLEISRRQTEARAGQLLTIGEISKLINYEDELKILLPLITQLISDRFGFYHVGIFLLDDAGQYAVLQAANSSGGQTMLKKSHRLKVGESGIVGFVAKSGKSRIALDVGQDATFFNNPNLPNTRSEVALPLKIRDKIIGVLDVQSEKPGAFTEEDTNTLVILADQVAIAIENTRLLEQTTQALNETRAFYQENLREGWKEFGQEQGMVGYLQSMSGGRKLTQPIQSDEINQSMYRGEVLMFHADGKTQEPTLVVPIKLRGQIIGVMHIKAPTNDRQWTESEVNLTEAISERLSLALENARLIQESQRQVIKEQSISEITGKIGSSINLENVLLTAVEELGRTIPGSEISIKLKKEDGNGSNE